MLKKALKVIPHAAMVMAGMLIVFFCIDRVNKPMAFMTNEFHKILTFLLALITIGQSVFVISYQRKKERFEEARRRKARQAAAQAKRRPAQAGDARPAQRPVRTPRA